MKKFLSLLCALMLTGNIWGNDSTTNYDKTIVRGTADTPVSINNATEASYPVTWTVTGKGNLMVRNGGTFLASGDEVPEGDYIDIWIIPEEGNSLLSLKVNGEEYDETSTGKLRLQVLEALNIEVEFGKAPERKVWTELAADSYDGGDGTVENPYQIATAEQFAKMAKDMLEGDTDFTDTYFELTDDINLKGNDWYPIGFNSMSSGEKSFNGKVDGNGFSIKGLEIQPIDDHSSAGLFGSTGVGFELRNLTIESGTVTGNMITGAFVGFNRGLIENCTNKATIACTQYYCGGIAGSNSKVTDDNLAAIIRRCNNYGTVTAGNGGVNGIAAAGIVASTSSIIEECANWGEIKAPTSSAGGITAVMEGGVIRHCFNRGYIISTEQVAGISASVLGRSGNCQIYNCYSASDLSVITQGSAGAIIGIALFQNENSMTVSDSYYDTSLYYGSSYGTVEDNFEKFDISNLKGMDTESMKSADFITKLNSETQGTEKWSEDNLDVNDGYPVFTFMASANSMNAEKEMNVYAAEGHIRIEGVDCNSIAEVFTTTGTELFIGSCERLSSKTFAPGLYLIKVCGQAYKVVVR